MKLLVSRMLLIVSACALVSTGTIYAQSAMLDRKQALEPDGPKREVSVPLRGRTVVLHVYLPKRMLEPAPLVLFSSGSGGWHQFDDFVATAIAKDGLPVCGISTHSYLTRFYTTSRPATVDQLVADYADIIKQAKAVVGIDNSRPVVLAGWSLGAGYAPVIASQPSIKPNVLGVISIAIEKENEKALSVGNRLLTRLTGRMFGPSFDIVQYLQRTSPLPLAIIQASEDRRASVKKANEIVAQAGDATSAIRVFEVKSARGHSFAGGRTEFNETLSAVLAWFRATSEPLEHATAPTD